jgi:hypothetical protein
MELLLKILAGMVVAVIEVIVQQILVSRFRSAHTIRRSR